MLDTAVSFFWPDGGMADTLLDDDASDGYTLYQVMAITNCSDAQIVTFVANDRHYQGLLRSIDRHDLADDPAIDGRRSGRKPRPRAQLAAAVEAGFYGLPRAEVLVRLRVNDVPAAPVLQVDEIHEFEQVVHNRHARVGAPQGRRAPATACCGDLQRHRGQEPLVGWRIGEHTDEVLASMGHAAAAMRPSGFRRRRLNFAAIRIRVRLNAWVNCKVESPSLPVQRVAWV